MLPIADIAFPLTLAAEGGSNPFVGTIYQTIAVVVVFLVVLTVLKVYAWGPILTGLQDREEKIRKDLEQAEASARQAEETLAQYRKELDQAQEQARQIIDRGRKDAETVAATIKKQAEDDINRMRQRAETEIEAAKEQALTEIYTQVATLVTDVAEQVLHREVKAEDHQQLIDESVAQLRQTSSN